MVPAPSPQAYTARHLTEQILASPTALEGERNQVTVLFADVVGSTKRVGDLDPEDGKRLLDGATRVAMEMPGAGALHNLIAALVYELLRDFVRARDLGLVFTDGVACIVGRRPDRVRIPDASFVSWERVPEGGVPEGFWPLAPDLAAEVVSPKGDHPAVADCQRAHAQTMSILITLGPR